MMGDAGNDDAGEPGHGSVHRTGRAHTIGYSVPKVPYSMDIILCCSERFGTDDHPRPMNGILVAMMVMNCTLLSSGSSAMCSTACPT